MNKYSVAAFSNLKPETKKAERRTQEQKAEFVELKNLCKSVESVSSVFQKKSKANVQSQFLQPET